MFVYTANSPKIWIPTFAVTGTDCIGTFARFLHNTYVYRLRTKEKMLYKIQIDLPYVQRVYNVAATVTNKTQ